MTVCIYVPEPYVSVQVAGMAVQIIVLLWPIIYSTRLVSVRHAGICEESSILAREQRSEVIDSIALELLPLGSALHRILIVVSFIAELHGESFLEHHRSHCDVICLALLEVSVQGYISR